MYKIIFILFVGFLFIPTAYAETYGSDITTGATPSCHYALGSPYTASGINDDNNSTRWASSNGSPSQEYCSLDTADDNGFDIAKMTIHTYSDVNGQGFKDWELTGSNDNFTSTTTISQGTAINVGDGTTQTFTFTGAGENFRYFRLYMPNTYSNSRASFYEIQLMECTDCASTSTTTTDLTNIELVIGLFIFLELFTIIMYSLKKK